MLQKINAFIKRLLLIISGKVSHLKIDVKCNHKWYGDSYGGFYINPDYLNEKSVVYSIGIGEDISFDLDIISDFKCSVYGFDPTPKSINWIKQQGSSIPKQFIFSNIGIGSESGLVDFYLPRNPNHVSGSLIKQTHVSSENKIKIEIKTLANMAREFGHTHIDLLKIDIEGSEYSVINEIINSAVSIDQVLIEFHDRFLEDGHKKSKEAIDKMRKKGYKIFAISDSFEEVSFIKI